MKIHLMLALILASCLAVLAPGYAGPSGEKLPTWLPNKALLDQLSPATSVADYQVQPPKGYELQRQAGSGGAAGNAWVGAPRDDGTHPYLMVAMVTPPPDEVNKYTLDQVLGKFLEGIQHRRKDWIQTGVQHGLIHGMKFARAYWKGNETETGQMMHGFTYVTQDGSRVIEISSQDFEPYNQLSLPLAEAATFTFAKR